MDSDSEGFQSRSICQYVELPSQFEYILWIHAADGLVVRSNEVGSEQMLPYVGTGSAVLIAVPISQILMRLFFLHHCSVVWEEAQVFYEKSQLPMHKPPTLDAGGLERILQPRIGWLLAKYYCLTPHLVVFSLYNVPLSVEG